MDFNKVEGPKSHQHETFSEEIPKESQKSKHLTFEEHVLSAPAASQSTVHHFTKETLVEDDVLQELDRVLQFQATQIQKELEDLEQKQKSQTLPLDILESSQTILAAANWSGWAYQSLSTTNEAVQHGVEFLENVLPHELLSKMPDDSKFKQLDQVSAFSGVFLSALNSGSQLLTLIYREKILQKSQELLKQFQAIYDENNQNEQQQVLSPVELKKIRQKLLEWEINLKIEEKFLKELKQKLGINVTSTILKMIKIPLKYFPSESVLQYTKIPVVGISSILLALEVIVLGLELKKSAKEMHVLNKWSDDYKKWLDQNQAKFKITENSSERIQFTPSAVPIPLTDKEHEQVLFDTIHQAKDLAQIRRHLKDMDIHLDVTLTSKEDFLSQLEKPDYREQFLSDYLKFQRTLEALHLIIQTSGNLLEKRTAIVKKKILLLKPHFHTIELEIKELKKAAFIKDMQQLLWKDLQDLDCTPDKIKEQLRNWGFYDSKIKEQNQKLLQAFEQFETAFQEGTNLLEKKQSLIHALHEWMDDPNAMEVQFQDWYQQQPKESLISFYVDRQETIEHTTKNALNQMVKQKHEIEKRFINFKVTKSSILLAVAIIALIISVTIAILGLSSISFGGAGLILLIVTLGVTAVSLGFLGASYYKAHHEKPNATLTLTPLFKAKKEWAKLKTSIHAYFNQAKEKKLLEVAKILRDLHTSTTSKDREHDADYQIAFSNYKKAKQDFEKSQEKIKYWSEKLKRLESHLAQKKWQDFADQASLQIGDNPAAFDTLRAFKEALQACNLQLLSDETKNLLEVQLGLDLEALQDQIRKNPNSVRNTLQEFFILDDAGLMFFINKQKLKMTQKLKT
jgi:hypothetical protein